MSTVNKVKSINEDLKKALEEIAKKHGLSIAKSGKCRYDDNGFSTSVDFVFAGGDTKEMAKLRSYASVYGLKEDVCNAEILLHNGKYIVKGMRNTKIILEQNGKTFTAPIEQVVNSIKFFHKELCL